MDLVTKGEFMKDDMNAALIEEMEPIEQVGMDADDADTAFDPSPVSIRKEKEEVRTLLSREEEIELSTILHDESKSKSAKDAALVKFVQANLGLVEKEASSFNVRCSFGDIEELRSVGKIGLLKAIERFDHTRGFRFSTMAVHWIRQAVLSHIKASSSPVHIPSNVISAVAKQNRMNLDDEKLSDKTIADAMKIDPKALRNMRKARVSSVPLDAPLNMSGSDGSKATVAEAVADENAAMPYDEMYAQDRIGVLNEILSEFSDRDRQIILSQVMNENKTQLARLGLQFGVSGERVRQIKEEGLRKIKKKKKKSAKHAGKAI